MSDIQREPTSKLLAEYFYTHSYYSLFFKWIVIVDESSMARAYRELLDPIHYPYFIFDCHL